jgi:ribulose-phosphate 3-epimerase
MKRIISPSLLSADFSRLESEIRTVETAGAKRLHLDVMDGNFVPNLTFGPIVINGIRKMTDCHLECHLMINNPDKYIADYADAGADTIIIHQEASTNLITDLNNIKKLNCAAGVCINPDTPIHKIESVIEIVDYILVMSVFPGFGGQEFISSTLQKMKDLVERKNPQTVIAVDGGVNHKTINSVFDTGIDIVIVGSGLFSAQNIPQRFKELSFG